MEKDVSCTQELVVHCHEKQRRPASAVLSSPRHAPWSFFTDRAQFRGPGNEISGKNSRLQAVQSSPQPAKAFLDIRNHFLGYKLEASHVKAELLEQARTALCSAWRAVRTPINRPILDNTEPVHGSRVLGQLGDIESAPSQARAASDRNPLKVDSHVWEQASKQAD